MMFSDEEIKEIPENSFTRPGDEIISIREVFLVDKFDKKDLTFSNESILSTGRSDPLDGPRSFLRDVFPEGPDVHARFSWTEEDGNIAAFVSESGFGTAGPTSFGKDLDVALKSELKEADTSTGVLQPITSRNGLIFSSKPYVEPTQVSSTSNDRTKSTGACKVDKADPRSRFHYVKYVKRHGRTVKLWECGICSREFQHQYTLMRHLPTHTDERNFHCDACGKSFRQLSTLSQHRAIHSTERPYACEVCHKTFNRVSTLISHRKTHSDEKPYKCTFCPKGFHQKGNLRNHLFTHTNERPYRCNICMKGFNQQSNLVCHKNKAHPDNGQLIPTRGRSLPRLPRSVFDSQSDASRSSNDHCEVTSSVGPYLPNAEVPSTSGWPKSWDLNRPEPGNLLNQDTPWSAVGSGVVVDPIKTYHMEVALATRQTPFALLKPNSGKPVLVKVIDTKLPGGKQMLVPATAEDLKIGGKIVVKNDENDPPQRPEDSTVETEGAVQIRVPVVAVVVARIREGGRLHLDVEEPHHAYHTALSADGMNVTVGEVKVEPCKSPEPRHLDRSSDFCVDDAAIRSGSRMSSTCSLPPPAPSPPLDFIPMDLFEPMDCIPMGPQITAVDNIDQPPASDDSDIFIGEFEESIPLSDSE